jgi:hypothetical protein
MLDPVTVSTGITYERDILWKLMDEDEWCICPFTRARIDRDELNNQGNVCLLAYIENFIKAQENREYSWDAAELLTCPLSRELFVDPVTVACGLTFEREALKKWFAENNFPDELIWQGKYVIKFVETRNGSSVAIKSLVNLYREKLKEEALNEQGSAQAMEVSPRMDVEQVRAARLRMFDQQDASPGDRGSRHDGGESNPKKRT